MGGGRGVSLAHHHPPSAFLYSTRYHDLINFFSASLPQHQHDLHRSLCPSSLSLSLSAQLKKEKGLRLIFLFPSTPPLHPPLSLCRGRETPRPSMNALISCSTRDYITVIPRMKQLTCGWVRERACILHVRFTAENFGKSFFFLLLFELEMIAFSFFLSCLPSLPINIP